jgi:hypothetical protein
MMAVPPRSDESDVDLAVDDPDETIRIGRKGSGLKCFVHFDQIDIPLASGVVVGATKQYRNRNRDESPKNYRHAHAYQRYWDPEDIPDHIGALRQESEWKSRHEAWNLALSFGYELDFLNIDPPTPDGDEEEYLDEEDEDEDAEYVAPAAPARKKNKDGKLPSLIMADTGSPNDLIGRSDVPKGCKIIQLDDDDRVELNTAGGTIFVTSSTEIPCTVLNEIIEPLVLDDSPTVLSIGKRVVHHGYDFVWRHGSKPYFKLQNGTKIRMEIVDDVPYIRTRAKQRLHSAAIAVPNRAVAMVAVKGCQRSPTVPSDTDESSSETPPHGLADSDSECDEESSQ